MYDIRELARAVGVTVSAIHRYTRTGVLEPPVNRGPSTVYGEEHFVRLAAIKALRKRGHSLAAIRDALAKATNEEIHAYAGLPKPPRQLDPSEIEEAHARGQGGAQAPTRAQARAQAQAHVQAHGRAHGQAADMRLRAYRVEVARGRQAWTRIGLCPGVELHVSAAADDEAMRVAREIEEFYAR